MAALIEQIAADPLPGQAIHFAIRNYQGILRFVWSDSNQATDFFHIEMPVEQWQEFTIAVMNNYKCADIYADEFSAEECHIHLTHEIPCTLLSSPSQSYNIQQ